MTTITTTDFDRMGSVGTLGPSCELKLVGERLPPTGFDWGSAANGKIAPIWDTWPLLIRHKARSGYEGPTYSRGG